MTPLRTVRALGLLALALPMISCAGQPTATPSPETCDGVRVAWVTNQGDASVEVLNDGVSIGSIPPRRTMRFPLAPSRPTVHVQQTPDQENRGTRRSSIRYACER